MPFSAILATLLLASTFGMHLWPRRLVGGQWAGAVDDLLLGRFPGDLTVRHLGRILLNLLQAASQRRLGKVVLKIDGPDHRQHPL